MFLCFKDLEAPLYHEAHAIWPQRPPPPSDLFKQHTDPQWKIKMCFGPKFNNFFVTKNRDLKFCTNVK